MTMPLSFLRFLGIKALIMHSCMAAAVTVQSHNAVDMFAVESYTIGAGG